MFSTSAFPLLTEYKPVPFLEDLPLVTPAHRVVDLRKPRELPEPMSSYLQLDEAPCLELF